MRGFVPVIVTTGAFALALTHQRLESLMRLLTLTAVLAASVAAPAFAEDLQFTLINNSASAIVEMYLSPHEQNTWGDNILSVPSVASGTQGAISVTDGETVCDYDIKVVLEGGASGESTQNLCELSTFTVHD
jgi:hypothetical protein